MSDEIIIVGAGQAGLKVAETLRKLGDTRPIRLLGDEPHLPYQRPPLSKKYLLGDGDRDSLWLQQQTFLDQNDIAFSGGAKVTAIDPVAKTVTLQPGEGPAETIGFGTLVLATGSSARVLPIPGHDLPGVVAIRSIDDADASRAALAKASRVVIVGGGYIGLEAAASMRELGKDVTVVEFEDRLLKRVACPELSAFFLGLHLGRGVEVRLESKVEAILGETGVTGVRLADGTELTADLVVMAAGGVANDGLARTAGLACGNGIVVDQRGETSVPGIYAAGDCAEFPSERYGRRIRLESVQNAIDQAKAVAEAIAGQDVAYDPVPWFWSDQYDRKLQIVGLSDGFEAFEIEGDVAEGRFAISYFKDGRLLAVSAVNMPKPYMLGRRELERG
jgi:3-phenylpropionate/trans-cinnamate dioxygenase ferredoxin reductase subunit